MLYVTQLRVPVDQTAGIRGGTASDSDLVPFGMRSFFMKTFVPDK